MYPDLFGIEGFSMGLMMTLGGFLGTLIVFLYLLKHGLEKKNYIDFFIVILVTLFVGIITAMLFENLYEWIKALSVNEQPKWTWSKTFYGGLFGGVITFLLMYRFYYLKNNPPIIKEILKIAPAGICFGHGVGRIGCFLNGCCYGIDTEQWYGIVFPGHLHPSIPTQLLEMAFLFILGTILLVLAYKSSFKYNLVIYMASYGVFRFLIEFIRGDERGELQGLSPSQYWCIVLIFGAIAVYFLFKNVIYKEENKKDEIQIS